MLSRILHTPCWALRLVIGCVSVGTGLGGIMLAAPEAAAQQPTGAQRMTERIDELLDAGLTELGWQPAPAASDAAFLRRIHLDLTGEPPTGSQVLDFLADPSSNKHAAIIDELLDSSVSASHLADQWTQWMLPEDDNPFARSVRQGIQGWLRDRFAENLRYDRLVADLLVASGPAQTGPSAFFVALEGKPEKIAAKTARVFMGVQLDCAECHDHPFDEWSQRDFWGFAAYFAQLSAGGEQATMTGRGEVVDLNEGDVMLPGTDEIVPPKPLVKTGLSSWGRGTRRQQLTLWLTAKENPFLARATVNRVWAMLFGQGLIEPIDDMRSLDMASHPQLLSELSDYFVSTGYDLRDLIQTLTNTRAYQRDTVHLSGPPPTASYAVMATKPLTERQLTQTLAKVARQIISDENAAAQTALANQLGKLRGDASEAKLGIVSALVTLHGDAFDAVTRESSSRLLMALDAPFLDERKRLQWLFLSTLNRPPSREEEAAFSELISKMSQNQSNAPESPVAAEDAESATSENEQATAESQWLSDLLWALLNSSEFAMTP